jgi:hypothetical protein
VKFYRLMPSLGVKRALSGEQIYDRNLKGDFPISEYCLFVLVDGLVLRSIEWTMEWFTPSIGPISAVLRSCLGCQSLNTSYAIS